MLLAGIFPVGAPSQVTLKLIQSQQNGDCGPLFTKTAVNVEMRKLLIIDWRDTTGKVFFFSEYRSV